MKKKKEKKKAQKVKKRETDKTSKETEIIKEIKKIDYNKQTKALVMIMVGLLFVVLISHFIIQAINTFDYHGVKFKKEKEGEMTFYKSITGLVVEDSANVAFKLRNDPRELEEIPLEGTIKLRPEVVLSISPSLNECPDTYKTIVDFSWTLSGLGIKTSAGTPNKIYAKEHNLPLIDCSYARGDRTVVLMAEGEKTKITQEKHCYIIYINDCEIQQGFERFVLGFLETSVIK